MKNVALFCLSFASLALCSSPSAIAADLCVIWEYDGNKNDDRIGVVAAIWDSPTDWVSLLKRTATGEHAKYCRLQIPIPQMEPQDTELCLIWEFVHDKDDEKVGEVAAVWRNYKKWVDLSQRKTTNGQQALYCHAKVPTPRGQRDPFDAVVLGLILGGQPYDQRGGTP